MARLVQDRVTEMASDPDGSNMLLKSLLKAVRGMQPDMMEEQPRPEVGSNKKSTVVQLDSLRREGNRFFKDNNYIAAMNLYSQCIVQSGETMASLEFWCNSEEEKHLKAAKVRKILFLSLSNRSETWLRLQDYRKALGDADRALKSEPAHAKCLVRRGKALEGLQRYEEACCSFAAALEQFPDDLLIQNSLRSSKTCYLQSHEGVFDLSNCEGQELDPCCEFVGPVEIQKGGGDGYGGRGVFLTKAAIAGQLLLVSRALAVLGGDPEEKRPTRVLEDYWIARASTSLSSAEEDLALHLSFCAGGNAELRAKLSSLFSGSQQADIPAMELFKPGAKWSPTSHSRAGGLDFKIDAHKEMLARMRKVVEYNAFTDFDNWGRGYSGSAGREQYLKTGCGGLWLLPSFLNHSCAPNCTKVYIGNVLFVRASRGMAAGEELSLAYCDISLGVDSRRNRLRKWGFECKCRRCLSEMSRRTVA